MSSSESSVRQMNHRTIEQDVECQKVISEMRIVERQLAIPAQDECFGRHGMQEHYLAYVVHEKCDAKSSAIRHKPIKELCCAYSISSDKRLNAVWVHVPLGTKSPILGYRAHGICVFGHNRSAAVFSGRGALRV